MSLLHLHCYPRISASAAAETKALGRGICECFVPVSSIFSPDKMKLSVQLEDGKFSPYWQAVNTFRNTRKHTKREKERSSSAFQVAASGHGSPSSNNPSKCCPVVGGNLTEEVRSYFGLHEVLFSIYQDLPGGSVPMCLGYVPVDKCHENCTSLLCSLKNLAMRDEKQSSLLYLHVSNTPFFTFPDVGLPPLLFWSPKHAFRLHPNLQLADYFSLGEKDLPFILEIITLQ